MPSRFEEEVERLARLSRAERFEQLISFPAEHTFKVIGRREGLCEEVQSALAGAGHAGVCLVERASARGRYISLTFTIEVQSGQELDALYSLLERLPGLAYLF